MTRTTVLCLVALISLPSLVVARNVMYVPSGDANDIVIIDLDTDHIIGRVEELENAHGLSASPTGDYLVAGSMQAGEVGKSTASKPSAISEEEHQAHHSDMAGALQPSFVSIVHIQHGHVMRRVPVRRMANFR